MAANDNGESARFADDTLLGNRSRRNAMRAAINSGMLLAAVSAPVGAYFGAMPVWVGVGLPTLIAAYSGLRAANDN